MAFIIGNRNEKCKVHALLENQHIWHILKTIYKL